MSSSTSVDVFADDVEYIPFSKVGALVHGKPHKNSVHRWASRGRNGVVLRSIIINRERCTTREWLNQFFSATDRGGATDQPKSASRSKAQSKVVAKRAAKARKRLAKAGI